MSESQWTRNDLMARREIVALSRETHDRGLSSNAFGDAVLDAFVDHMNAHHPKPGVQWCANKDEVDAALRGTTADGMRNAARIAIGDAAVREAVARVIEAEKAVDPVDELAEQIDTAARAALREVLDQLGVAVDAALVDEVVASVSGESRRIAALVLGQEADQ